MKKSTYERKRLQHHIASIPSEDRIRFGTARDLRAAVQADIRAAEAAGVVWGVEEEELPAKLLLIGSALDSNDNNHEVVVVEQTETGLLAVASIPSKWSPDRGARRVSVLRAMVETYNLWNPEGTAMQALRQTLNSYYGSALALQHAIGRLIRDAETKGELWMLDITDITEAGGPHEDDDTASTSVPLSNLPEPVREFLLPLVEEYRSIQAEISPKEKRKKALMKEMVPLLDPLPADRVLDQDGRPLTRREYRVSESVDETKLLEAGVPMKVIEACRVRKVSVYYKIPS